MSGERLDWTVTTPISSANLNKMNTPPGVVCQYAGAAAPAGWLFCDAKTVGPTGSGADYEGDQYLPLYDIIQNKYGGTYNWAGGGKVNLPLTADRVAIGKSGTKALASVGGSETIAIANLPSHGHSTSALYLPDHTHHVRYRFEALATSGGVKAVTYLGSGEASVGPNAAVGPGDIAIAGSLGNTGSGEAYNPPYIVFNYIIKY